MKRLALGLLALCAVAAAAIAQTSNYFPIPSNVCLAKGALLVAQDRDNATCIAAVASGKVLASAGTGTIPTWIDASTVVSSTLSDLTVTGTATIGAAVLTSETIGGGTAITKIRVFAPTCSPSASSAAIQTAEQSCTVSGVTTADKIIVNGPAPTSLCPLVGARVSGADTVALAFSTLTASACTPASGTYNIVAIRS